MMTLTVDLNTALERAQALLTVLEAQVAGFGSLHIPAHLQVELEEKRREVTALTARLAAAQTDAPPYRGLQAFGEADADDFFGRDDWVARLVKRIEASLPDEKSHFLALVGASGSGKSSLLRAGVLPALRRGALPGSATWRIVTLVPGAHPLESLAVPLTWELQSVTATSTLIDDLQRDSRSLHFYARKLLVEGPERLVLAVDQFEELFTVCKDPAERQAFVDALLYAAALETAGPTVVIIALRADFYAACAQFAVLREALAQQQEYLGPLDEAGLRAAIEEPARRGDWTLEPGLVDVLLRDVGTEPGALPLLSHALLETWRRRDGRALTVANYYKAGGVAGALTQTAETVYGELPPEQQAQTRALFLRLTEPGEGTLDTRRRVALTELHTMPTALLKTLADVRLLTTTKEAVEVAHEALIREWPRLRDWLEEDREGIRLHHQISREAQEWLRAGREASRLYRGARLAQAVTWAEANPGVLNALEQEFLTSAQQVEAQAQAAYAEQQQRALEQTRALIAEQKRREAAQNLASKRTRILMVLLGFLILAVIGVFAYYQSLRWRALALSPLQTIPGGVALIGATDDERPNAGLYSWPAITVTLPDFELEIHEVTNAQYCLCRRANGCSSDPTYSNGVGVCDPDQAQYPVTNVTLRQAAKYCQWLGRRLPTELEWEWAARGVERRLYPTGKDLPTGGANVANIIGAKTMVGSSPTDRTPDYGLQDMTGNVTEWTVSFYIVPYTDTDYLRSYWPDAVSSEAASAFVVARGGSYDSSRNALSRYPAELTESFPWIGFRCLRGVDLPTLVEQLTTQP